MKLRKTEFLNILNDGWDARQRRRLEAAWKHSEQVKFWKLKKKAIENKVLDEGAIRHFKFSRASRKTS